MKYTVLVVTYNRAKFIRKCLDSIFNQTYKNFELVVVDDGSTDNTKEIIDEYKKMYKFRYYYKKNTGVGDTRNYAISKVKTKYFMFVDSDDYIEKDILEKCSKFDDYDLLCFRGYRVLESGEIIETLYKEEFYCYDGNQTLKSFINKNSLFLVPWGYIYNIDVFKKNNLKYEKDYVMEDAGLTPIIILNSKNVISIDSYGYYYVQTDESIIRTKNQKKIDLKTKSILFHVDNLYKYINDNVSDEELKMILINYLSRFLIWYGTTLDKENLKKYVKELKKRRVIEQLEMCGLTNKIKKILCSIDYRLYYNFYGKMRIFKDKIKG